MLTMKRELTSSTQCTAPDNPGCTGAPVAVPIRRGQSRPVNTARSVPLRDESKTRDPLLPTFFHQSARCSPMSDCVIAARFAARRCVNTVDSTGATLAQQPGDAEGVNPARCDSPIQMPAAVGVNARRNLPLKRGSARSPPLEGASWGQGP